MRSLLLLSSLSLVTNALVYTCMQFKNGVVFAAGYNVACAVVEKGGSSDGAAGKIVFTDGRSRFSVSDLANEKTHCKSSHAGWTFVKTEATIECSTEFTVILTRIPITVVPILNDDLPNTVSEAGAYTLVSPRGGIRLTRFKNAATTVTTVYSGAGNDESDLFLLGRYNHSTIPAIYFAFDPVITVHSAHAYTTFSATSNIQKEVWPQHDYFSPGSRMVVSSSGWASNVQNRRGHNNLLKIAPFSPNALVGVNPIITDFVSGVVPVWSEDSSGVGSNNFQVDLAHKSSFKTTVPKYLRIKYPLSFPDAQIGRYMETWMIIFTYIGDAPPPTTTVPHTTTRTTHPSTVHSSARPSLPPSTRTTTHPRLTTHHRPTVRPTLPPSTVPPTTTAPLVGPPSYCACNAATLWLEIVFVVDISDGMGSLGLHNVEAVIQSVLYSITVGSARFQTRVGVVSYDETARIVYDMNAFRTDSAIDNLVIPYSGKPGDNIKDAFLLADSLFSDSRAGTKRVMVLVASSYNGEVASDPSKLAKQFKDDGGKLMIVEYIQPGEESLPDLTDLSSPGYSFSNQDPGAFTGPNIIQAFCDANCYCLTGLTDYSVNNPRGAPTGGCYEAVNTKAVYRAAHKSCERKKGFVASLHDADKQMFLMGLYPPKTPYWIGYTYEKGWKWTDGSNNSTFTNWAAGQPSVATGGCTYAKQFSGFRSAWNSGECQNLQSAFYMYVCQQRPCDSTYYCFD